jgi:5-methylcytosine-specific restriction enzyme A
MDGTPMTRPRRQQKQRNIHTMAAKRNTNAASQHRRRNPPTRCASCGKTKAEGVIRFELDHIIPKSQGGLEVPNNYRWLCAGPNTCHSRKTETEAAAGRARAIAQRGGLSKRLRDLEPDPGRLTPDDTHDDEQHAQPHHDATADSHAADDEQPDDQTHAADPNASHRGHQGHPPGNPSDPT